MIFDVVIALIAAIASGYIWYGVGYDNGIDEGMTIANRVTRIND